MTESTSKTNVFTALVEFQKKIPSVTKDSTADTGKFSYDYASLDRITPIIFERLASLGVSYTAAPTVREDGIFVLRARLTHGASGTDIVADYPLGNPNAPAQAIGSAITYARRYALLAMTGVAPTGEDDDGKRASEATASAAAAAITAPAKETPLTMQEEIAAFVNNPANKVTGEDANGKMEEVAPGKTPAQWTVADLKKGREKLVALSAERKADK